MSKVLDRIFKPKSIAAIGVTDKQGTVGYAIMENLLSGGFNGKVFPVNPKRDTVHGVKSYNSVKSIKEPVDLAVIATPAKTVPGVVKECGEAGVGGIVIISAGFKEAGEEGERMFEEILATAKKYGMRIIGPNCLGFITPAMGLNASFATKMALPGSIAFISQSGALCTSILDWSIDQNVGFSHFVSIGSMVDVGFHDLIDYFGADNQTSCILIYMESLTNVRRFMSAARAFARYKPIIVLKAGKSLEGAKATLSHTGSLAGNDSAFDAAFKRAGIIRVDSIAQLFHSAQALAMQPRPASNRLAILTNAGGPGVLATDFLVSYGGQLAKLSDKSMRALNEFLPSAWSHSNPVDTLGDVSAEDYSKAFQVCQADENVDAILAICVTQAVTSPTDIAAVLSKVAYRSHKPVFAVWMGERDVFEGREILERAHIPNYRYPESAVDVFLKMYHYFRHLQLLYETPPTIPHRFVPQKQKAVNLIQKVLKDGRKQLTEEEGKELLSYYEIPLSPHKVAKTLDDAAKYAEEIGFPIVMKIASPDIGHKTEAGGVVLNIKSTEEAAIAFNQIIESAQKFDPQARIQGVLVEKMVSKKFELLIGAKKDPLFGPVIAFGWGGVTVEVLKDINLGLPPLNMALAQRIIEKTKIYKLLQGFRGMEGVDMDSLKFLLVKFSYLLMDFPEIQEIDINPFVMDSKGGVVLDAHVVLDPTVERPKEFTYNHLVISPYPEQYIREFTMRNGEKVLLRPIRPEDEPMEAEMFQNLSSQSIYFRFFGYIPQVNHKFLIRFTQIDYDREMAIIAELDKDGKKQMLGVVRLISDTWDESAEFAIVVADPWQRNGLGRELMDFMLSIAKTRNLKKITADVLITNRLMLQMFERRGFKIAHGNNGSYQVELNLELEAQELETIS